MIILALSRLFAIEPMNAFGTLIMIQDDQDDQGNLIRIFVIIWSDFHPLSLPTHSNGV
jgi:hypothetical protein